MGADRHRHVWPRADGFRAFTDLRVLFGLLRIILLEVLGPDVVADVAEESGASELDEVVAGPVGPRTGEVAVLCTVRDGRVEIGVAAAADGLEIGVDVGMGFFELLDQIVDGFLAVAAGPAVEDLQLAAATGRATTAAVVPAAAVPAAVSASGTAKATC
ncbi:hypothetical protein C448_07924 [Halococcus morrhuae DSM 1307]|uniref:Uncharacterized protein n=1 Tax=Halococcus morrhuae DSM 1307 TaxID=931277 RepID=M0MJP9_HALMO|nr:hypothetical protein C448_07924 [Halococcus morrhuae DSM 1307]